MTGHAATVARIEHRVDDGLRVAGPFVKDGVGAASDVGRIRCRDSDAGPSRRTRAASRGGTTPGSVAPPFPIVARHAPRHTRGMAKASTRRLKVFRTQIGFHELAVATASKAAALRAFGARQDLFALGLAAETDEADVVAAATAQPDVVLKRPVGSDLKFGTEAVRPRIADIDPGGVDPPEEEAKQAKAPPRPDRAKLTAAEQRSEALAEEQRQATAKAEEAMERLRAEERRIRAAIATAVADGQALEKEWRRRQESAEEAVERELEAFRLAGGEA